MNMLQATASNKRTFVCIDALDEFAAESRVKLLNLIKKKNRQNPSRARIALAECTFKVKSGSIFLEV